MRDTAPDLCASRHSFSFLVYTHRGLHLRFAAHVLVYIVYHCAVCVSRTCAAISSCSASALFICAAGFLMVGSRVLPLLSGLRTSLHRLRFSSYRCLAAHSFCHSRALPLRWTLSFLFRACTRLVFITSFSCGLRRIAPHISFSPLRSHSRLALTRGLVATRLSRTSFIRLRWDIVAAVRFVASASIRAGLLGCTRFAFLPPLAFSRCAAVARVYHLCRARIVLRAATHRLPRGSSSGCVLRFSFTHNVVTLCRLRTSCRSRFLCLRLRFFICTHRSAPRVPAHLSRSIIFSFYARLVCAGFQDFYNSLDRLFSSSHSSVHCIAQRSRTQDLRAFAPLFMVRAAFYLAVFLFRGSPPLVRCSAPFRAVERTDGRTERVLAFYAPHIAHLPCTLPLNYIRACHPHILHAHSLHASSSAAPCRAA